MIKKQYLYYIIFIVVVWTISPALSQPSIPKSQIPSNITSDVRAAIESLYSSDPVIRAKSAHQLETFGVDGEKAIPFLASMLSDDILIDPVIEGMNWMNYDHVVTMKTSPSRMAARTLRNMGEPAVDPTISVLKRGDWKAQVQAARILGSIESPKALNPLIDALKNPNWQVRESAADAVADFEDDRTVKPLIEALHDEDWHVRVEAAEGLGEQEAQESIKKLIINMPPA